MKAQLTIEKVSHLSLLVAALTLGFGSTAFAHVTITPAEVVTSGYQIFTVNVPNEKDIPTVSVKLLIPDEIQSATPTQKAGWQIDKETKRAGEEVKTTAITWKGGSITDGTRDEFSFSAKVPNSAGELKWKAYQTYSDGTVVAWDRESENGHGHDSKDKNTGPLSVTEIVSETAQDVSVNKADQAAADAKTDAERSLYIAVAALAVGIVGIFLGTRNR